MGNAPTFKLNIPMHKCNTMHPPNSSTQLTPQAAQQWFRHFTPVRIQIDKLKEFPSSDVLYHKAVVRRGGERVKIRNDRGVGNVLGAEIRSRYMRKK